MVPAEVRVVSNIPVLGSGKVDFVGGSKLMAGEKQTAAAAAQSGNRLGRHVFFSPRVPIDGTFSANIKNRLNNE
jgi:hypothetical protein